MIAVVLIALAIGGFFLVRHLAGPGRLMAEVERIVDSAEDRSHRGVGKVWDQVATILEAEEDAAALARLVRDAQAAPRKIEADGFDFRIESYWMAQSGAVFRLGELGTDEAAKALVELLSDEDLSWDGEGALNIAHAISVCGKLCLPYLEAVSAEHPRFEFANALIPVLKRGEIIQ